MRERTYYDALKAAVSLSVAPPVMDPARPMGFVDGKWTPGAGLEGLAEAAAGHELVAGSHLSDVPLTAEGHAIEISAELGAKLGLFMDRLQRWRQEARQGSLSDLIWGSTAKPDIWIGLAACPAASSVKAI